MSATPVPRDKERVMTEHSGVDDECVATRLSLHHLVQLVVTA